MANTKQVHRIELIIELDNEDVGEWVDDIYDYNDKVMFQNSPSRIISSDTTPLDIDSIEKVPSLYKPFQDQLM